MDLPELVAQHQTNVFAFLYRMCGDTHLAEDLTQEVFVRAIRAAGRYEPRGKVTTWLFSIAANGVKDYWWRQTRARVCWPGWRWSPGFIWTPGLRGRYRGRRLFLRAVRLRPAADLP